MTRMPACRAAGNAMAHARPRRRETMSNEAALDEVRRAHFLYGLEEIQAVAERTSKSG